MLGHCPFLSLDSSSQSWASGVLELHNNVENEEDLNDQHTEEDPIISKVLEDVCRQEGSRWDAGKKGNI